MPGEEESHKALPFFTRVESWLVPEAAVYGALRVPASSVYFCKFPFEVNHFKK